jgi:hypothetical protein
MDDESLSFRCRPSPRLELPGSSRCGGRPRLHVTCSAMLSLFRGHKDNTALIRIPQVSEAARRLCIYYCAASVDTCRGPRPRCFVERRALSVGSHSGSEASQNRSEDAGEDESNAEVRVPRYVLISHACILLWAIRCLKTNISTREVTRIEATISVDLTPGGSLKRFGEERLG